MMVVACVGSLKSSKERNHHESREKERAAMYSNPRLHAVIENWPSGQHRTTATFTIERHPRRGERGTRTTVNPKTGQPSAPKVLTYARRARIVDGSDGKTYILQDHGKMISIMQSNMQFSEGRPIFPDHPEYPVLLALFD
jgi:hypothetical protein